MFRARDNRFALHVDRVREITPMVVFKAIKGAPDYVPGLMNYRGEIAPVVDLTALLAGAPSRPLLSTRIILIRYDGNGREHTLGLLAERVTDTMQVPPGEVRPPGIDMDGAPHLAGVILDNQGMIQVVDVDGLLPPSLRQALFPESGETVDNGGESDAA